MMPTDTDFFRFKMTYADGEEYFSRSYRAKGPASAGVTRQRKWTAHKDTVFTLQKLGVENGELAWYDL